MYNFSVCTFLPDSSDVHCRMTFRNARVAFRKFQIMCKRMEIFDVMLFSFPDAVFADSSMQLVQRCKLLASHRASRKPKKIIYDIHKNYQHALRA